MDYQNYTPVDQSDQPKKQSINVFLLIFFIFSLSFLVSAVILQPKNNITITSSAKEVKKLANLSYQYLYEINYPITRISNQTIEAKKFIEETKKIFPHLDEKELIHEFNRQMLSFWALTDYFQQPFLIPQTFKDLLIQVENLQNQYLEQAPTYSGYLIKIRYKGYYGEALEKINNLFGNREIKPIAEEKIISLINKNLSFDQLKKEIENDEEVKILNNSEKALLAFEKQTLYPPPFDDPDFCLYLSQSPLNQYSKVFPLKTFNREKNQLEDYAYLVFYISEKEGENLHLDCLINQKIKDYRL